jgi:hypothetical protein
LLEQSYFLSIHVVLDITLQDWIYMEGALEIKDGAECLLGI